MTTNRILLAAVFATILSACSDSTVTSDPKAITESDLSLIDIEFFAVKLPSDLDEDEVLLLEHIGEKGIISSIDIGQGFDGSQYLKVFLNNSNSNSPTISFVSKKGSTKRNLSLGKASLTGFSGADTIEIGEVFAYASAGGNTAFSDFPKGNDLAIRITIKGR